MTNNNLSKDFIALLTELFEGLIKKAKFPVVVSCKIISKTGDNKYLVKRNGNTHLVRGRGTYPPDSIVEVMRPDGDWNRAFIVY